MQYLHQRYLIWHTLYFVTESAKSNHHFTFHTQKGIPVRIFDVFQQNFSFLFCFIQQSGCPFLILYSKMKQVTAAAPKSSSTIISPGRNQFPVRILIVSPHIFLYFCHINLPQVSLSSQSFRCRHFNLHQMITLFSWFFSGIRLWLSVFSLTFSLLFSVPQRRLFYEYP